MVRRWIVLCFALVELHLTYCISLFRRNTVYRSPNIMDNLNPFFSQHIMLLEELCYCDLEWPLRITILDWEESGNHRVIGMVSHKV